MVKKRKGLKLSPDDHVVGMKPREKSDLFAGCNEPGKEWFHPDAHVFMKAFCRLCKNADCIRAKGSVSPWHTRMAEQVDYLLNDPNFSDMKSPEHLRIAGQAFEDIGNKMMKLEISRERQDWAIPEDGPTDGFDKVAPPATTDQFDEAVKKLAKARGKEEPNLPRPEGEAAPAHFQDDVDEEDPYEYDTHFPSSDGKRKYHVILDKANKWSCECDGYSYRRKCKHIDTVREWYEEQLRNDEDDDDGSSDPTGSAPAQAPAPMPPPEPTSGGVGAEPPRDPRLPPEQKPFNTPMPQGGVMLGGGEASAPQPDENPWAIPDEQIVEPGAKVTLKGDKPK